jgi:hypothetical protein
MLAALVVILALTTSAPLVHAHEATHKDEQRLPIIGILRSLA